jgi:hypothetical protein
MPMTVGKAACLTVLGIVVIVVGLTTKQFYAGNRYFVSNRPIPRWQGVTLFLVVGGAFFVIGLSHLIIDLWSR